MCIKCFSCDNYIHNMWVLIVVVATDENVTVWMTHDVKMQLAVPYYAMHTRNIMLRLANSRRLFL